MTAAGPHGQPNERNNRALVIGCDQYWTPSACLKGAVRDALAVHGWLTRPDGGAIAARNVITLLSPSRHSPQIPSGLIYQPATNEALQRAIAQILRESAEIPGERLYVHFSGHGLSCKVNGIDEPAIIPEDFDTVLTSRALSIRSIYEALAAARFVEQFYFIDACRNIPIEGYFNIDHVARPPNPNYTAETPHQFVCYATARGMTATEDTTPYAESGVFTSAVLSGLSGAGNAKVWDAELERYLVRWSSLFAYAEASVQEQRKLVGAGPDGDLMQEPRQAGERDGRDPVLATFAADMFADEKLTLSIHPQNLTASARVVIREDAADDRIYGPPVPSLIVLTLPPRLYTVKAQLGGSPSTQRTFYVPLYYETLRALDFETIDTVAHHELVTSAPRTVRGVTADDDAAELAVVADDVLSIIEIFTPGQRRVGIDAGFLQIERPGSYIVRITDTAGVTFRQMVDVEAGEALELAPPRISARKPYPAWLQRISAPTGSDSTASHPDAQLTVCFADHYAAARVRTNVVSIATHTIIELTSAAAAGEPLTASADLPAGGYLVHACIDDTAITVPTHLFSGRSVAVVFDTLNGAPLIHQFSIPATKGNQPWQLDAKRLVAAQRFAANGQLDFATVLMKKTSTSTEDPYGEGFYDVLVSRSGGGMATRHVLRSSSDISDGSMLSRAAEVTDAKDSVNMAGLDGIPVYDAIFVQQAAALLSTRLNRQAQELLDRRLPHQSVSAFAGDTAVDQLLQIMGGPPDAAEN